EGAGRSGTMRSRPRPRRRQLPRRRADPALPMLVYLNGEYVPAEKAALSPFDRGFLFADGVYEAARFHRGRPYRLADHVARLSEGLEALRIKLDAGFYAGVARRLLDENGLAGEDAIVYAQVTRGAAP